MVLFSTCGEEKQYTYNQDIAPIIHQNCVPCHREAGAAPFSLTSFKQVNRKKNTILKVTQSGYMPPWPADRNYSHFIGEKYLTQDQKQAIKLWIEQGAPEGEGSPPPVPEYSKVSRIGEPDTTIWFDSIFVPGKNKDLFLIVTLPIELREDKYIRALEFVPNKNNLVHHMNGHLLNYDPALKKSVYEGIRVMNIEVDSASYRRQFDSLMLYHDDKSYPDRIHSAINYLPGVEASIYPEGIGGFTMSRKAMLVANDMHFGPTPKGKWDHSHLNIFYSDDPPKRPVRETMLGTNGVSKIEPPLVIPPNTIREFHTSQYVDQDISVLTVNPHMHLLGKSFKAYAIDPAGDTIRLIHIPKWDFRWQYFYTFKTMVKIPEGSVIHVEAVYDNTANNPDNPYDPPQLVKERTDRGGEGMRTTDEMLQFIITWLPYQEGDENTSLEYSGD
ncbi:hypothetical protein GYB22_00795 [bacterium]|nr:hypothetical protein [bacterium]